MQKKMFDGLLVKLASPEDVKWWSHGTVESPDTINYRTGKPKQKGLFCEAIFGPMKNYECSCGKYKWVRYKGIVCERCGVEVTTSRVRRERMGHIELAAPVVHIWYYKATPSRIGLLLNLSTNEIEKVLYFVKYVVTEVNEDQKKNIISSLDKDYANKINELDKVYEQEVKKLSEEKEDTAPKGKKKEGVMKEDELRRVFGENKTSLEKEYSRIKSILSNLKLGSTILESDYRNVFYRFDGAFTFASGSQALLTLLKKIDVQDEIKIILENFSGFKGEERKKAFKKVKLLINLHISDVRPEWMVLSRLPVIPPDLRPVVQLEGGKFASSDVNLFYRRVLMRNLRLKKMIQVGMPDVVKKNEIRLLQESVNNLMVGETANTGKTGAGIKVFKSLTDMLSGKEGIFRKNLLGKRVDYSGRSVITVGPNLKLDECGLPLYVAVKMFTPFIIGKLIERKIAHTPKQAEKLIKDENPIALRILEEVIKDKYVLLNRAPTLHRLSIQAFKPKLMPGKTIRIHPLVTPAFNADFDGDQMAVHLPLSEESQREARDIISADKNVLKPASGEPVITHSQDMVMGIYYLTDDSTSDKNVKGRFATIEEALQAFRSGDLHVKDRIILLWEGTHMETLMGRVVFNSVLPEKAQFLNEKIGKKWVKKVLDKIFDLYGREEVVRVANDLKDLWFKYATLGAVTISALDLVIPQEKEELLNYATERVNKIHNFWYKGYLSDEEKHRLTITEWSDVKSKIEQIVRVSYGPTSNVFQLVDSWARGTWGQMTQMAGMKGLVSSPSGKIIELPIKSSLLEWFTPIEYFISAHGARKGKADTALKTAESGYLTRRLVDASQELVVKEFDCKTDEYLLITKDEAEMRGEQFGELIFGRVTSEDVYDQAGALICAAWSMITKPILHHILVSEIDRIKVRSSLTCHTVNGVCQQCYGMDLSNRAIVELGIPVGVISSQSIGEPGTQLTMRTFHSWWVANVEGDMTQGIKRIEELFEVRNPKKPAIVVPYDGVINIYESQKKVEIEIVSDPQPKTYIIKDGYSCEVRVGDEIKKWGSYAAKGRSQLKVKDEWVVLQVFSDYIVLGEVQKVRKKLTIGTTLKVKEWAEVFKGQVISTGSIDIREYMHIVGPLEAQRYIVKEIKKVFTSQGQDVNDKYMETIVKQLFSKVLIEDAGNSSFIPGTIIKYEEFLAKNRELEEQGKQGAKGDRLALGLTQVAKESDSWLSAASFQETIRVMVEASTKGAIDHLSDLKANVIIGRLLPVGEIFRKQLAGEEEIYDGIDD
jgi:DNA-directed RNA polymerase subunit beta'